MDDLRAKLEQALTESYQIERELGGGGMSRTYLATEVALQRKVVIKVLAPELLAGISVERFRREVLLAAQLQHPHVVPVLVAGDFDGIPWFTMPYVEGNSLRHRLDRGAVPSNEAIGILRDVAKALSYAHEHGIVHRDIKPDNVLLSSGSATVTDFGIAKAINAARTGADRAGSETLTQVGTSIGTPAYMAPEQALGDPDTDYRADIYAFGVMAYELLTGELPFKGANPSKLLAAHINTPAPDLAGIRPDTPPALAALVSQCLSKAPDERPQDAKSMARVLESVTTSGGGETVPSILRGGQVPLGRALGFWAIAAGLVVLTAWAAREAIGLPEWVLPGAIGVMLAGIPVLAFTAYAQRTTHRAFTMTPERGGQQQHGTMATLALKASPHLSWKRAWTGGAVAVGGFAVLVIGFMVMRALGIGPMGSLQGKGVFGAHEKLVVADFRSPADDSTLGATLSEALRTDLAQSASLNVMTRVETRELLGLMQRPQDGGVPFDLAREIATREGAKAVLDGDVVKLGSSYVISAQLRSALDGSELVSFRETAANEDDLINALGKLTRSVRERTGESLKDIRASTELERVTTPSLAALRKYVEGSKLADEAGESDRGIALIEEAVRIDTAFAMAWRKLSVLLGNEGRDFDRQIAAVTNAYNHRDRLTETERLLTEASYWTSGPNPDDDKAIEAYEAAVRLDSLNTSAINNVAILLGNRREYQRAEDMYRKVIKLPVSFGGAFGNLLIAQIRNGHISALDSTVQAFKDRFPESKDLWEAEWWAEWGKGNVTAADSIALAVSRDPETTRQKGRSAGNLSNTYQLRGQLKQAKRWGGVTTSLRQEMSPGPGSLLGFAFDTAYYEANFGDPAKALAAIRRGLARAPIEDIPSTERPWQGLMNLAAQTRNPELARQAAAGFMRDQLQFSQDSIGAIARINAIIAVSENRWRAAIDSIRVAEGRFELDELNAAVVIGMAFDEMGQPDSAIVAFEKYLSLPDPFGGTTAHWKPRVLQWLGEQYESKGNNAKAIEYYSQFTELWKDADPEFQPRVREIRDRISRLQGEVG